MAMVRRHWLSFHLRSGMLDRNRAGRLIAIDVLEPCLETGIDWHPRGRLGVRSSGAEVSIAPMGRIQKSGLEYAHRFFRVERWIMAHAVLARLAISLKQADELGNLAGLFVENGFRFGNCGLWPKSASQSRYGFAGRHVPEGVAAQCSIAELRTNAWICRYGCGALWCEWRFINRSKHGVCSHKNIGFCVVSKRRQPRKGTTDIWMFNHRLQFPKEQCLIMATFCPS